MILTAAFLLCSATLASAAPAQDAECQITAAGQRIDGPCRFTPRKGGSFDVSMTDGRTILGAAVLSLDLTGKGVGRLTGNGGRDWGSATRQTDGACWASADLTVCVRAVAEKPASSSTAPSDAERETSFGARCHMGACDWVIQSPAREIGKGSAAVPGRLVTVTQRRAYSEHPGDYPDHAPAGLDWSAPVTVQVFCSMIRPAISTGDGWVLLPLPDVFGASEAVTLEYLRACHPGANPDPYAAVAELGYQRHGGKADTYPDFDALTKG